jgi:hypothetical protein
MLIGVERYALSINTRRSSTEILKSLSVRVVVKTRGEIPTGMVWGGNNNPLLKM